MSKYRIFTIIRPALYKILPFQPRPYNREGLILERGLIFSKVYLFNLMGMKLMGNIASHFAKICGKVDFYAVFALSLIQNRFEAKILIYHYKVEGFCY